MEHETARRKARAAAPASDASVGEPSSGAARGLGPSPHPRALPDIQGSPAPLRGLRLDRVGMQGVQAMARLPDGARVPAVVDACVSLDHPEARGVHMSRLYCDLEERLEREPLDLGLARSLVTDFVASQQGLAHDAWVRIAVTWPLRRPALESDHSGWRHYPVVLEAELRAGELRAQLATTLSYSSTCPCSAALSREVVAEHFRDQFGSGAVDAAAVAEWLRSSAGMPATPHSQRSEAEVTVVPSAGEEVDVPVLIARLEEALSTPVQTAVKREDEQAFAVRNAANLMFVEDAARRLRQALEGWAPVSDYRVRVSHRESLHAHDAVSTVVRGRPDGLRP